MTALNENKVIEWKLEKRSVSSLIDYHKNPRKMSKLDADQLKQSFDKFGIIDKPVINPDGLIIGGHQRKRILKRLAIKEVECWVPDRELDEREVEELNIRLNKNSGDFDWDILANEFEVYDLVEWGFSLDDFNIDLESSSDESEEKEEEKCDKCGQKIKKKKR